MTHDPKRSREHQPISVVLLEPAEVVFVALSLVEPPTGDALVGKLLISEVSKFLDFEVARGRAAEAQPSVGEINIFPER